MDRHCIASSINRKQREGVIFRYTVYHITLLQPCGIAKCLRKFLFTFTSVQIHLSPNGWYITYSIHIEIDWVEMEHYSIAYFDWSTVTQNFCQEWGSYALCKCVKYSWVYTVCMTPTRNRSIVLLHFKHGNVIDICNGIMFTFYQGLPHMCV